MSVQYFVRAEQPDFTPWPFRDAGSDLRLGQSHSGANEQPERTIRAPLLQAFCTTTGDTTFFGRLKNELFYARDSLNTTIDHFVAELDTYICWYNEARIKISLGSLGPMEHRKAIGIAV
jgi:hypothetical protein